MALVLSFLFITHTFTSIVRKIEHASNLSMVTGKSGISNWEADLLGLDVMIDEIQEAVILDGIMNLLYETLTPFKSGCFGQINNS